MRPRAPLKPNGGSCPVVSGSPIDSMSALGMALQPASTDPAVVMAQMIPAISVAANRFISPPPRQGVLRRQPDVKPNDDTIATPAAATNAATYGCAHCLVVTAPTKSGSAGRECTSRTFPS